MDRTWRPIFYGCLVSGWEWDRTAQRRIFPPDAGWMNPAIWRLAAGSESAAVVIVSPWRREWRCGGTTMSCGEGEAASWQATAAAAASRSCRRTSNDVFWPEEEAASLGGDKRSDRPMCARQQQDVLHREEEAAAPCG